MRHRIMSDLVTGARTQIEKGSGVTISTATKLCDRITELEADLNEITSFWLADDIPMKIRRKFEDTLLNK